MQGLMVMEPAPYISVKASVVVLECLSCVPERPPPTLLPLKLPPPAPVEKAPLESYADVGGLEPQIQEIKEAVELPLTHPELYEDIGIKPPKVWSIGRAPSGGLQGKGGAPGGEGIRGGRDTPLGGCPAASGRCDEPTRAVFIKGTTSRARSRKWRSRAALPTMCIA